MLHLNTPAVKQGGCQIATGRQGETDTWELRFKPAQSTEVPRHPRQTSPAPATLDASLHLTCARVAEVLNCRWEETATFLS